MEEWFKLWSGVEQQGEVAVVWSGLQGLLPQVVDRLGNRTEGANSEAVVSGHQVAAVVTRYTKDLINP